MVSNITRFTLRLSRKLDEKVNKLAKKEELSKNAVIVKACKAFVDDYAQNKER